MTWTQPGVNWIGKNLDAVTTATPLSFLKMEQQDWQTFSSNGISLADMMIGILVDV